MKINRLTQKLLFIKMVPVELPMPMHFYNIAADVTDL